MAVRILLLWIPRTYFVLIIILLREPVRGIQDSKTEKPETDWRILAKNVPLRYC